ncbi:hypothetical protein KP509_04G109400 [Ceratopteris richardii]|uniref:Uncharacterized protein n=1 Tax=Ceratopteris richardii TaxID=49495 RepID=A0A8T2V042_CERRI|nr:hypothetical protein KP509_04G109400 [Ceratopteris richardii]
MAALSSVHMVSLSCAYSFSRNKERLPLCSCLCAQKGDEWQSSSNEQVRTSLKDLDEQLLSSTPVLPRQFPDIEEINTVEGGTSKPQWPEFSTGSLIYIAGGLFLLTVVNNLLYYLFLELPNKNSEISQEKNLSLRTSNVDSQIVAPDVGAQNNM